MKKCLAMFLVLLVILPLASCGISPGGPDIPAESLPQEKTTLTFGFIPLYLRDDFYQDLTLAAQRKAEELGVELLVQDPNGSAEKSLDMLDTLSMMDIDAVCLNPAAKESMVPKFRELVAEGVPVVTFDSVLGESLPDVPSVALQFDFEACGRGLGQFIEKYMIENGRWNGSRKLKTAVLWLPGSTNVGVPIIENCLEYLDSRGMIEVVAKEAGKTDRNYCTGVMKDVLMETKGQIDLLIGFNYEVCMGGVEACEEYGLTQEDIVAFSQLWGTEAFEQLESDSTIWKGGLAYSPVEFGETAVQVAYDLVNGAEMEQVMRLEPMYLSPENISEFDWESIVAARETLK